MNIPHTVAPRPDTGLYNAKLGMWLFLASEVMFFGGLFSAYVLLRLGAPAGSWPHGMLDVLPAFINTLILICSSVTVVQGWAAARLGNYRGFKLWTGLTILLAFGFLGIKGYEYHGKFHHYGVVLHDGTQITGHLVEGDLPDDVIELHPDEHQPFASGEAYIEANGLSQDGRIGFHKADVAWFSNFVPRYNTFLGIYFAMTGLHALHVVGGIVVLLYLWGPGSRMYREDHARFVNRLEVSGLYWHFVELVWIFLFPVLYLL